MSSLCKLNLSSLSEYIKKNLIGGIYEVFRKRMKLILWDNEAAIPSIRLEKDENIEYLNGNISNYTTKDLNHLLEILNKKKKLKFVDFTLLVQKNIKNGNPYEFLNELIKTNQTIKILKFSYGQKIEEMKEIGFAESLQQNECLTEFYMNDYQLGETIIKEISEGIEKNDVIQLFSLRNQKNISDESVEAISNMIQKNTSLIKLMILSRTLSTYGQSIILKAIKKNKFLKDVYLESNAISNGKSKDIASLISENTSLEYFGFKTSGFSGEIINRKMIRNALRKNTTLKKLFLPVSDDSASIDVLVSGSLTSLDLSVNHIDDTELKDLIGGLSKNNTLTELSLANGYIQSNGMKKFAKYLSIDKKLKILDLQSNVHLKDCQEEISEIIENNKSIEILNLKEIYFDITSCKLILKSLAKNETITHFIFDSSRLNVDLLVDELSNLFLQNSTLESFSIDSLPDKCWKDFYKNLNIYEVNCHDSSLLRNEWALERNFRLNEMKVQSKLIRKQFFLNFSIFDVKFRFV